MIEDKLTHDERLRLECIGQATALWAMKGPPSAEVILTHAKEYEKWIKGEANAATSNP